MTNDLKTRLVFIDTSAFESKNFQFGEYALLKLQTHLEQQHIHLLITEITINEIRAHMEQKSKEARALIKKYQREAMFLRNVPELPCYGLFEAVTSDQIFDFVNQRFQDFLDCESVEVVELSSVNISLVFDKYFRSGPPFGGVDKKSEFPDAFALEAVRVAAERRNHDLYVISTDGDMRKYAEAHDNIFHLEKIDELLDLIVRTEAQISDPAALAQLVSEKLSGCITERIREYMEDGEFYSDDIEGIEDEIHQVKIESIKVAHVNVVEASRDEATLEVEYRAELEAHYSFADYDRSPWDPEDKKYVFVLHNAMVKKHFEKYSCYVTIDLDDGLPSNAEIADIEFDFIGFNLSDEGSEVLSYREYDINGE